MFPDPEVERSRPKSKFRWKWTESAESDGTPEPPLTASEVLFVSAFFLGAALTFFFAEASAVLFLKLVGIF